MHLSVPGRRYGIRLAEYSSFRAVTRSSAGSAAVSRLAKDKLNKSLNASAFTRSFLRKQEPRFTTF